MKEIAIRAASGAVYVALVLGAAWLGAWASWALFLLVAVLAAREWHDLYWRSGEARLTSGVSMALTAVAYCLGPSLLALTDSWTAVPWLAVSWSVAVIAIALRESNRPKALVFALSLVAYLALPFLCAPWMVQRSPSLLIGFMLMLWANDTGAYLVGRAIGRNKLMPSVSPGKTWEGLIGGMLATLMAAWVVARWVDQEMDATVWLISAPFVTAASTIGDLFESFMKRKSGVKDSGAIMPGHGGVLDRFDGYLLAAPVMALLVRLLA